MPNNPIISPDGNPLTSRSTTNLAIAEALDGRVFGIYRGYGQPLDSRKIIDPKKKPKEGKSLPFAVFFESDDVTPVMPLPQRPVFRSQGKESQAGIEDGRIVRYNGGFFYPHIAARKPNLRGITYSGQGAILRGDLSLKERFPLKGIPYFMKDLTPSNRGINELYIMYLNPRIPDHKKNKPHYKQYHREHQGIWVAISYDLRTWDVVEEILRPLENEKQIGASTSPVDEIVNLGGDLAYIHGMKGESETIRNYYSRAVLFNPEDPTEVVAMTDNFLVPTKPYEINKEYKIEHVFPMGTIKRKVKIGSRVYDAHVISAGTGDVTSSLYFVLLNYLKDSLKPMDQFKYHKN